MPLESATFVNQLDQTRPTATDVKSEGDDVMRLIKSTLKNSFPNVGGAMNASHTELNRSVGLTEDIQPRLSATIAAPGGETLNRLPAAASRLGGYLTFNASTGQPEVNFSIGQASASSVGIFNTSNTLRFFTAGTEKLSIDAGGTATFAGNIYLDRSDLSSEGGQINFRRASDNADAWAVDVVGAGSDTSLRFVNIVGNEAPLTMTQQGNLGMNISTPISTGGRSIHLYQGTSTGTVSDNATLRVQSANRNGNVQISGSSTSTNGLNFLAGDVTYSAIVGEAANSNLVFRTGGTTERMRIDASGNVGIGDAPSAWGSAGGARRNLNVRSANITGLAGTSAEFSFNLYYDGSDYRYQGYGGNASGLLYRQEASSHLWYSAPSGAAGAIATLTERMRIDASGNVISNVNTTAPTLSTNQQMVFALTSNTNLRISVRGTDGVTRVANLTLA